MDLMRAPSWVPRVTRIGGQKVLEKFRAIVRNTMDMRLAKMKADRSAVPEDFLTLLLEQTGPEGLTKEEIEDNILTFIGAGHETTARALA
ncbi:cytochrome P450, partial [Mesorhizobium sp. M1A.T.Ca.IN.004.03.1.1]